MGPSDLQPGDVVNSHIIPGFLHRGLFDKKHRVEVLTANPKFEFIQSQQGIREYLLCDQCDNVLVGG